MSLTTSDLPTYYSIDDILATQERIPCKFLVDVPKLGNLNPCSKDADMQSGTALELPFWLVEALSLGMFPVVQAELPKIYSESYQEIFKADANFVNLHKVGLHLFELGNYVKEYDPTGQVAELLIHSFKTRILLLLDLIDRPESDPTVVENLDVLEGMLFNEAQQAKNALDSWLTERGGIWEAASTVDNHKKRKRVNSEGL